MAHHNYSKEYHKMDPEFAEKFKAKNCMQNYWGCIETIEKLHSSGHKFTRGEFDRFIERVLYGKSRSFVAAYFHKHVPVFNIMFQYHSPSVKQYNDMLQVTTTKSYNNYDIKWYVCMLKECKNLAGLDIDKLEAVGCPKYKICMAKPGFVMNVDNIKEMIIDYFEEANNALLVEIGKYHGIFNIDLLKWVVDRYNKDNDNLDDIANVITLILQTVGPDDSIINAICEKDIYSSAIIVLCLTVYNIDYHKLIKLICDNSGFDIIFDPAHKIKFDTVIFNYIIESNRYYYEIDISNETFDNLTSMHKSDTGLFVQKYSKKYTFNAYKYWKFLDLIPDDFTFKLSCGLEDLDLFNLCTGKFHMVPTNCHIDYYLNSDAYNYGYYGEQSSKYHVCDDNDDDNDDDGDNDNDNDDNDNENKNIIIKMLLYRIVPSKENFRTLVTQSKHFDEIFNIFVKFGLQIDFDDVIFAADNEIKIDGMDRFGIVHDAKLYHELFIRGIIYGIDKEDEDAEFKKYSIDYHVLKLRTMCYDSSISKIQKYMDDYSVKLDRYCVEAAAFKHKHDVFGCMLKKGLEPSHTAFILLAETNLVNYRKYYLKVFGSGGYDSDYMATSFDIRLADH